MRLRRSIRKTIQRGSVSIGTAVSYNNGRATVRIGGTRLTNLPVMGAVVPGQQVAVDYSAGVVPVVRPLGIPTTPVTPAPLATTKNKRVQEVEGGQILLDILRPDYGMYTLIYHEINWETYIQYVWDGVPVAIRWAGCTTWEGYRYYCVTWDAGNMYQGYTGWGTTYLTIPVSGKYLISLDINLGEFWANDWAVMEKFPGYYRIQLFAGGTLLAEESAWKNFSVNLCAIASLAAGDVVSAWIYPKNAVGYWTGGQDAYSLWPWVSSLAFTAGNNSISIHLLPGTMV